MQADLCSASVSLAILTLAKGPKKRAGGTPALRNPLSWPQLAVRLRCYCARVFARMRAMPAQPFEVSQRQGSLATVQIISVKGAITFASSPAFQDALTAATAPRLIVDFTEVSSLDSMAIGTLVRAFVSCHKAGRKLVLVGLNYRVKNILQITGVDPLFEIYASIADAQGALI